MAVASSAHVSQMTPVPSWRAGADEFAATAGEDRRTTGPALRDAVYYWLLLAEGHLTRRLFGSMLRMIAAL